MRKRIKAIFSVILAVCLVFVSSLVDVLLFKDTDNQIHQILQRLIRVRLHESSYH